MSSKTVICPYCGHKYTREYGQLYAYCPECQADPDEPLPEYSQAAGFCDACGEDKMKECYKHGICANMK